MPLSKIKSTGIEDSSVTSASIADNSIVNADINSSAAIASSKLACGSSFETTTTFNTKIGVVDQNIALLGFKMAVNEGLTVFNLVDGIVDEFHDESGTDEGEGSNDTYCSSSDFYQNLTAGTPRILLRASANSCKKTFAKTASASSEKATEKITVQESPSGLR